MSQLRKSASFRSRIPVRARVPQRRCSSPQPVSSSKSRQNKKNSRFFYDRYYSSSSFSSSDESHDSDEPLKVKYDMIFQYHKLISIQTEKYLTRKIILWVKHTFASTIGHLTFFRLVLKSTRHSVTSWKFPWRHAERCEASINWFLLCLLVCWLQKYRKKFMKNKNKLHENRNIKFSLFIFCSLCWRNLRQQQQTQAYPDQMCQQMRWV